MSTQSLIILKTVSVFRAMVSCDFDDHFLKSIHLKFTKLLCTNFTRDALLHFYLDQIIIIYSANTRWWGLNVYFFSFQILVKDYKYAMCVCMLKQLSTCFKINTHWNRSCRSNMCFNFENRQWPKSILKSFMDTLNAHTSTHLLAHQTLLIHIHSHAQSKWRRKKMRKTVRTIKTKPP